MGLADAASAARLKVSAALLPELRDAPSNAAQRFHLDAPGWWRPADPPPLLPAVADAVWDDRPVAARYRRRDGSEVERRLEPYGLVLKAGVWYVIARAGEEFRSYRVDRFTAVSALEERFPRDESFDLPSYWEEHAAMFARSLLRERVVLRLTPDGARRLPHVVDRRSGEEALGAAGAPAADGRVTVTLAVEGFDVAYEQLLALGPEVEVLEPGELRGRFAEAVGRMGRLYGPGSP
ncbi:hypothetical protein GCM10020221_15020 [Streptomyces thioluteus]|uniref:WYL domain-containing protein n=1 Tax=Streptomyces thioluteus TaxID=66431 RepID=A0ABN3WNH1_STRTU